MRPARRFSLQRLIFPLVIGVLAFSANYCKEARAARCPRTPGSTEKCQRSVSVKGSELLWESLSRGLGSTVAL